MSETQMHRVRFRKPSDFIVLTNFNVRRSTNPFSDQPKSEVEFISANPCPAGALGWVNQDAEFLSKFTNEAEGWRFIDLDVAAWKVPYVRVPLA